MEKLTKNSSKLTEKKPKDLLRAIGKIEHNDWNIREIEKKIEQSKKVTNIGKSKEKVPKWNREQFEARQNRLTQPKQDEEKYKTIDNVIKSVDKKLKEGAILEGAKDKVSSITMQFKEKQQHAAEQDANVVIKNSNTKPFTLKNELPLEKCYFCKQRVYLMEKVSAEQLIFHRTCLKCYYCNALLKIGSYAFDRDSQNGKFYCIQHFKLQPSNNKNVNDKGTVLASPLHTTTKTISTRLKLSDTVDTRLTPERIEFENIETFSDGEPSEGQIDETEWTDKNFLTCSENDSDDSSSDQSEFSDDDGNSSEEFDEQMNPLENDWLRFKLRDRLDTEDDYREYSSEGE